jgi:hypothetical protein
MASVSSFLVRGLLAGLVAGVLAFGVAYVVGEPSVRAAIALEAADGAHRTESGNAGAHGHGEAEVPRSLQETAGLLTGTVLAGVTLGGLVGVLSALALGRFGRLGVRASTLLVTGIGFVCLYVVPFAAYPPNPPAVGERETIGLRTGLYFLLVAISVIGATTAVLVGRQLGARWGAWYAGLASAAGYLLVMTVAVMLLPGYAEIPAGYPAALLYEFRAASFLTSLTLWTVLGVTLAELAHRASQRLGAAPAAADRLAGAGV